ncbi:unnamed protein product [Peniophora sp. CBMAI 1063]|nr:unnamed protein product [Peniophora sp. CBMAI 1063]
MGTPIDPTYPLLPAVCFLAAASLLLLMLNGLARQTKWNFGVGLLTCCLIVMNLTNGMNTILWSDNADIKLYVYCDIVSRIQIIGFVIKSTATLIITRRLYLIASLQSVDAPSKSAKRWDTCVEWTLGVVLPLLVAGPIYYSIQTSRFVIWEGFGCANAEVNSVVTILLIPTIPVIFPLISVLFYYPKVAYTFYRHTKDVNHFLRTNGAVSRTVYLRVLLLASIDIAITLPVGITYFILNLLSALPNLTVYPGWKVVHTNWEPAGFLYPDWAADPASAASQYFSFWTWPVLAFVIFGLFGLSGEALASYRSAIRRSLRWVGLKPLQDGCVASSTMDTIRFGECHQESTTHTAPSHSSDFMDIGLPSPVTDKSFRSSVSEGERYNDLVKKENA